MRASKHRPGFTLVEMLVALVIVLVLSTMLVIASLRMSDKNQVPKGASIVQGLLAQAKTRAMFEKRAVGIRFLISLQNPAGFPAPSLTGMYVVDQLQYVHDPGDFADGWVTTDYDPTTPVDDQVHPDTGMTLASTDPLYGRLVYGPPPGALPYTGFTFFGAVLPGDSIEFHGGGQTARVEFDPAVLSALGVTRSVYDPTQTGLGPPFGPRTVLVLDRPLDRPIQMPPTQFPRVNYRIIRQPRPIAGEAPISLPREVAIIGADLTGYYFNPTDPPANRRSRQSQPALTLADVARGYVDMMFTPSGQVMGSAHEALFLWLSDSPSAALDPNTGEPFDSNWAIVAVYTRTGGIAVYPVNQYVGPGANPYLLAQLGRGTGM